MRLRAEHCFFKVAQHQIVNDLSMNLSGGEIVSLLGANGAGKTSLLRMMAGELIPSSGEVFLGAPSSKEVSLSEIGLEAKARQLAYLPQRSGLEFPFSVGEVIEMGRYPQLTGTAVDVSIKDSLIREFDLGPQSNQHYTSLSGGEKQRVQIARVLAQLWDKPESAIYLFDEPTAPLDLAHQIAFFTLLRKLANAGAAILLVTHDINLASRFSDRLLLLKKGNLLAEGSPSKVITAANIKSGFAVDVQIHKRASDAVVQISF
ncbi:MAG: iron complex transport system ATP-binding protein [Candidatus Azotimanducaceae bacterium]|jgi:iron complex transport system ATP-binding protein